MDITNYTICFDWNGVLMTGLIKRAEKVRVIETHEPSNFIGSQYDFGDAVYLGDTVDYEVEIYSKDNFYFVPSPTIISVKTNQVLAVFN